MTATMRQVRAHLDRDEPDYSTAAQLGPEAIGHLEELVKGDDPLLAAKAAYLVSLIPGDRSVAVLEAAAKSPQDQVRVAAAAGIRNVTDAPLDLLDTMLKDRDAGVRKIFLRSIEGRQLEGLKARVQEVAERDDQEFIRQLASRIVRGLR